MIGEYDVIVADHVVALVMRMVLLLGCFVQETGPVAAAKYLRQIREAVQVQPQDIERCQSIADSETPN